VTETKFWRSAILLVGFIGGLVLLAQIWSILIPFILGLALAYLVYPLVDPFVALGLRQDRVVMILYALLLGAFVLVAVFLLPHFFRGANAALQDLPSYARAISGVQDQLNLQIQDFMKRVAGNHARPIAIHFDPVHLFDRLVMSLPRNIMNVAHWGLWIFIIPFVSFFALTQGKSWINVVFQWTPSEYVESLLGLLAEVNATLGGYIRGQILDGLIVAVLIMSGLSLLGVDGAVFLGCITGFLNFVPLLAPIVGGTLALMAAVFQEQSISVLTGIFFLYLTVRLLDDFIFIPLVVGHNVRLHPVLMLFAVLAGFELAGFLGLVFAVPATAVIKVIVSIIWRGRQDSTITKVPHVYS